MTERPNAITFTGHPLTLVGPELTTGGPAPDFSLRDSGLAPVSLADTAGKTRIFVIVPSLDTPVCDAEARRFNESAATLSENAEVIVVSRDTAFAQGRWCAAAGIERLRMLSDHIDGNFGKAWGYYIKENGLLARAIVVLDPQNVVRYVQLVPAIEAEPNYDEALAAAKEIAG
jgi:thiol peroxidase